MEKDLTVEISLKLPEWWEQKIKERDDATPEAEKGKRFKFFDYNPQSTDWLSRDWSHMWDTSKAIALVPNGKGGFDKYPKSFKKGDIVAYVDKDSSAFKAGSKPMPMIVIQDQLDSHLNVCVRYLHQRDNCLADQFYNPNDLRHVNPQ